jgi:hypothetical protein
VSNKQFPNLACFHLNLAAYRAAGIAPADNFVGAIMLRAVVEDRLARVGSFGGPGPILDLNDCSGLWSVENLQTGRQAIKDGLQAVGLLEFACIGNWCRQELFWRSWYPKAGFDLSEHFGRDISIDVFKRRADVALARFGSRMAVVRAALAAMEKGES